MGGDKSYHVVMMNGDEQAFRAVARRLTIITSLGLAAFLLMIGGIGVLFWMYPDLAPNAKLAAFPAVLGSAIAIWAVAVAGIHFFIPRCAQGHLCHSRQ